LNRRSAGKTLLDLIFEHFDQLDRFFRLTDSPE
jgi:hypothetical protein